MEKSEESLYIKVLVWAYNKKQNSFKMDDLYNELKITKPNEKQWITGTFLNGPANSYPLFSHYQNSSDETFYLLSDKGMSAAIGYLSLEESKFTSRRAEYIALWALGVTSLVGVIQIVIAIKK
jgi:hypothetical protein